MAGTLFDFEDVSTWVNLDAINLIAKKDDPDGKFNELIVQVGDVAYRKRFDEADPATNLSARDAAFAALVLLVDP